MNSPSNFSCLQSSTIETQDQLDAFWKGIDANPFVAPLPSKDFASGWTAPGEPSKLPGRYDGTTGDAGLIALGIRVDEKTVPPAAIKLQVDIRAAAWCVDNASPKCPGAVRRALAADVEEAMLAHMPAKPTTAVLLYDTTTGAVFVDAASGVVVKALPKLWERTFGHSLPLRSWSMLDRLRPELADADIEHLTDSLPTDDHLAVRQDRAGQFLAWLWWRCESSTSDLPKVRVESMGDISWVAAKEVGLRDKGNGSRRLTVRAADAAADPAVRAALIDGHEIESLGVQLQVEGGHVATVTLVAKDGDIRLAQCELGRLISGDAAEQAIDLANKIENVCALVGHLFLRWGTGPGNAENLTQQQHSLRRWLESDLREWLENATNAPAVREVAS